MGIQAMSPPKRTIVSACLPRLGYVPSEPLPWVSQRMKVDHLQLKDGQAEIFGTGLHVGETLQLRGQKLAVCYPLDFL